MTHRAFRYDVMKMSGPRRDHRGYLIADALLARTGIQEYTMSDGTVRRELRPENEVFHPDSLATISGSVVVNNHPPVALDAKNTKQYAVGFLKGDPKEGNVVNDCKTIMDTLTIYDEKTIDDVLNRKKNQVSQGYYCDVDLTPGVDPVYGPYDAIQTNIKHNHTATAIDAGRAGPEVGIKLDSANHPLEFGITYILDSDEEIEESDGDEEGEFDEDEDEIEIDEKWSIETKKALPNSSFAHVDAKGNRFLPYKDMNGNVHLPHLKIALSKIDKVEIPAGTKMKIKTKLEAAAKKHGLGEQKKDIAKDKVVPKSITQGENLMIIFKLDGMDYQVEDKYDGLFTKVTSKMEELKTLKADNAQLAKNLEASKEEIEKLKVIVNDEADMEKRVEEKIQLKDVAKKLFPEETKIDSLSTIELQKKIVKKVTPEIDVEKMDSAFIRGAAFGVMSSYKTDATRKLEGELGNVAERGTRPEFNLDSINESVKNAYNNAYKGVAPSASKENSSAK